MNSTRITLVKLAIGLLVLCLAPTLFAEHDNFSSTRLLYPPDSVPFGMTYGDWSAAWWQYVLSIPASTNPAFDTTGAFCGEGQSPSGPVFFLNPSGTPGVLVTRTCTVPSGKALWIPIILNECSTAEPPPSHGDNPRELRTCAGTISDGIGIRTVKLTVDHVTIHDLRHFRTVSPFFDFVMPDTDNIFGLNGLTSGSSVSDGYSVMLKPLPPGRHEIHSEGDFVSGPAAGLSFRLTYNLIVQ